MIPFRLMQNGPLIRYTFTDPDETLELRLGENSSRLELVSDAGTEKVGASKLQEKIRGTIVLCGDLAFKFLYWPTARVLGEENVRTRKCWKLQLRAPSHDSPYSNVLLWVDKASGALMRMEGYDWDAKLIKRFEVVSAQKSSAAGSSNKCASNSSSPGRITSRRALIWRLRDRAAVLFRSDGRAAVDSILTAGSRHPERANAADADRISRRSQRACDREIPCRAIPPQRVSLPRRFAFAQTQNLSSAGCADSLRPLRYARGQRR